MLPSTITTKSDPRFERRDNNATEQQQQQPNGKKKAMFAGCPIVIDSITLLQSVARGKEASCGKHDVGRGVGPLTKHFLQY
jgi:hypothetical protein